MSGKEARKEDRVSLNFSYWADRKIAKTPPDWIRIREQPGRHGFFEGFLLCVKYGFWKGTPAGQGASLGAQIDPMLETDPVMLLCSRWSPETDESGDISSRCQRAGWGQGKFRRGMQGPTEKKESIKQGQGHPGSRRDCW